MTSGPPSSSGMMNQLAMQMMTSNQQEAAQESAYTSNLNSMYAADAAGVQSQFAGLTGGISSAIKKKVQMGTILTSPGGVLGNPALAMTKLTG